MAIKYRHTILLVDDEVSILKSLNRLLRKKDLHILTANDGVEGLDLLKKAEKPVSLIVSDQRMPKMTGVEFLEKAKEIFPDAIRFLLTGYSDVADIIDAVNRGEIHRYVSKPWNDDDLVLQVCQSLEQYELVLENRRLLAVTRKQNRQLGELNRDLEKKVEERSREIIEKNKKLSYLNKELESNLYNTVRAFVSLTEMHASSLAGHGRRVSFLSREMAQLLHLPECEVTQIEIAALLHDMGKLGLPQKLMDYTERTWNSEELDLYQKHPEEGQEIVRFISKLEDAGNLIRSHHERYDGRGYPDQLSEEAIPLGSRIIAVADTFDKITNLKLNAQSHINEYLKEREIVQDQLSENELLLQAAIHHIKHSAFTCYDPDVVKKFLDLIKTKEIPFRREKKISIDALKEGMVLSRSLYTEKGRFLLPYDTVLTDEYVGKLQTIHKTNPIGKDIYVIET